jgi:hypothetical protein
MFQVGESTQKVKPVGDDLLPYRRLVELQKQMIEMANQHEHAKRACHGLRERMALEIVARQLARQSPIHRLRQSASAVSKLVSGWAGSAAQFNPFRST